MPIHDWTRVPAGIFHDFHQMWSMNLRRALNAVLPQDHYALVEQNTSKPKGKRLGPDVLTLQFGSPTSNADDADTSAGGVALATRPQTSQRVRADMDFYTRKKNIVTVRHVSGDRVVAVIEIVSPGNKSGRQAFAALVDKTRDLIARGVHVLLVDLFPPTTRDPNGLHAAVWEEFDNTPQPLDPAKPLTAVSYEALGGGDVEGYIEPLAVGARLPDMPVFLRIDGCVMAPLEATYSAAWAEVPTRWQRVVDPTVT